MEKKKIVCISGGGRGEESLRRVLSQVDLVIGAIRKECRPL